MNNYKRNHHEKITAITLVLSLSAAPAFAEYLAPTSAERSCFCHQMAAVVAESYRKDIETPNIHLTRRKLRHIILIADFPADQYAYNMAAIKREVTTVEESKESVYVTCIDRQANLLRTKILRERYTHD